MTHKAYTGTLLILQDGEEFQAQMSAGFITKVEDDEAKPFMHQLFSGPARIPVPDTDLVARVPTFDFVPVMFKHGAVVAVDEDLTRALNSVREEIQRARSKFPGNRHTLAALSEEMMELHQAILSGRPLDDVLCEAKQVACVAIRLMTEGDADFPEVFEPITPEADNLTPAAVPL